MINIVRFPLLLLLLTWLTACQPSSPAATSTLPVPAPSSPVQAQPTDVSDVTHADGSETIPADVGPDAMVDAAGFTSQFAVSDRFLFALSGVPAAPGGQAYQGWLTSTDGALLAVGQLDASTDGHLAFAWTSPTGENLLARFTGFEITLEPADGSDAPTGEVVYVGAMDAEQVAAVRLLFVTNTAEPATPLNTPFIPGILAQMDIAIQHIQNAQNAEAIGAYDEMSVHLEHIVNILEGAAGERFQDYNADGAAQNPGDGFGVKGYARQAAGVLGIPELSASIETDVNALQDQALAILGQSDLSQAAAALTQLHTAGEALRDGPVAELYRQANRYTQFSIRPSP